MGPTGGCLKADGKHEHHKLHHVAMVASDNIELTSVVQRADVPEVSGL